MHRYSYGRGGSFQKNKKKFIGLFVVGVGISTLLYFFFPLISYHLFLSSAFVGGEITSPIPQRYVLNGTNPLGGLVSHGFSNVTANYKDARNWFPYQNQKENTHPQVDEYEFSIPSQGIDHAKVSAVDFDLSKHLVQYFTTSKSPIEKGTSVIFGHSTLPQWFDPKNYTAIFAKLHTIKSGDGIIITVHGKDYKYKVFSIGVTDSKDPNIFSQSFDNSYITIITCTPPGTTWKRLVVRAALQEA